jgi:hypothetical protein
MNRDTSSTARCVSSALYISQFIRVTCAAGAAARRSSRSRRRQCHARGGRFCSACCRLAVSLLCHYHLFRGLLLAGCRCCECRGFEALRILLLERGKQRSGRKRRSDEVLEGFLAGIDFCLPIVAFQPRRSIHVSSPSRTSLKMKQPTRRRHGLSLNHFIASPNCSHNPLYFLQAKVQDNEASANRASQAQSPHTRVLTPYLG